MGTEKYGAAGRFSRPAVCSCIVRGQLVLPWRSACVVGAASVCESSLHNGKLLPADRFLRRYAAQPGQGPSSFYYAVARPRAHVRAVCRINSITANCCQQTSFCGGTPHSPVRAASACESSLQDKFLQTRGSELRGRTESSEAIRRLRTILSSAQNRVRPRQGPL